MNLQTDKYCYDGYATANWLQILDKLKKKKPEMCKADNVRIK
jgi:hypothetical protein